jgi:beta-glucan synthesis-associated protein KRE6
VAEEVRASAAAANVAASLLLQVDTDTLIGKVSLSAQWAPFDPDYAFLNTSSTFEIYDDQTEMNHYLGGSLQQSTSALSVTDQDC